MSTEKPRKPFGYCRHGEHWKCPIIIDIIRVDGGGQRIARLRMWLRLSHRRGEIDMWRYSQEMAQWPSRTTTRDEQP